MHEAETKRQSVMVSRGRSRVVTCSLSVCWVGVSPSLCTSLSCPLSALSPSLCHPPACRREGSLGRFAEPAARGFRSLGAVRTPLDVATRGFHATMRLGRYACSAPCDRAPGGFYWLVHQDDLIGAVRHQQRSGELWGAERTGALTRSVARPVPPEHARTP